MSGHSKWSSIKHKKGAADAKRGKLFSRLAKEIIISARDGGGDSDSNPRLRTAINNAKSVNMPNANIDRAIKRGTGEIDGANYEHYMYEGYGQNGVAILVECLTDNRNRTVGEVRHAFSKYGGNMAETGAVSWNFDQKGLILIPVAELDEDEVMMVALEAGAEDVALEHDFFEIITGSGELHNVSTRLEKNGYTIEKAELTRIPKNSVKADEVAEKLLKLIEMMEDLDDVQTVFANFEISDEVMDRILDNSRS
ncbi:MAG: YebC/PmpR family DNA-binding transcriptional regulator [Candidatus Cloacimonetes bacterium]|nr:YebC/PmpR family DNA-binding transcriptional regulator [Candidatus Cloacimonadota bacterium]